MTPQAAAAKYEESARRLLPIIQKGGEQGVSTTWLLASIAAALGCMDKAMSLLSQLPAPAPPNSARWSLPWRRHATNDDYAHQLNLTSAWQLRLFVQASLDRAQATTPLPHGVAYEFPAHDIQEVVKSPVALNQFRANYWRNQALLAWEQAKREKTDGREQARWLAETEGYCKNALEAEKVAFADNGRWSLDRMDDVKTLGLVYLAQGRTDEAEKMFDDLAAHAGPR